MKATAFVVVLALVLLPTVALADVPGLINHQGTLIYDDGTAVDTTVAMTFTIYTDSTGGTSVWTETQSDVQVSNGIFNVLLGRVNAISDTVFDGTSRWLGVQVEGYPELEPRQRMVGVGYSFKAAEADTADHARHAIVPTDGDWTISGSDMYSEVSGNVGIGIASPASKLDVSGAINADSLYKIRGSTVLTSSLAPYYNTSAGLGAGTNNTGKYGTFIGAQAGHYNTGWFNTFVGSVIGEYHTTGNWNTFLGYSAAAHCTTGEGNTILGSEAGGGETSKGSYNVFIGHQAGYDETGSYKLYIESSDASSPLIWGDFSSNEVVINGNSTNNVNNRTFFVTGQAGGTTAWYNDSDEQLKRNITPIPDALEKVQQLRGVNFEWKDAESHESGRQMGFVAQEAVQIIPEVVSGENGHYAMQYGPITALLVEAIKEQQSIIDSQQEQIKELTARLVALER